MYAPYKSADLDTTPFIEPWRLHLQKAADLIREKGLAKNERLDFRGGYCVHGAIGKVAVGTTHGPITPAEVEAFRHLGNFLIARNVGYSGKSYIPAKIKSWSVLGESSYDISPWNNAPERTAEEVIAALEGAARS